MHDAVGRGWGLSLTRRCGNGALVIRRGRDAGNVPVGAALAAMALRRGAAGTARSIPCATPGDGVPRASPSIQHICGSLVAAGMQVVDAKLPRLLSRVPR